MPEPRDPKSEGLLADKVAKARAAGYSAAEIETFLSSQITEAKNAGYSDGEIQQFLGASGPPKQEDPPKPFMDRLLSNVAARALPQFMMVDKVLNAAKEGAKAGFGDEPLGLSPENDKFLQETGIYTNPKTGLGGPLRSLNEAVLRPAFGLGDTVLRAMNAATVGVATAVGQTAEELGASSGDANRLTRDVVGLAETAAILAGTAPVMGISRGPTGIPRDVNLGTIPQGTDFAATARLFGGENAAKVDPIIRRLYQEKGILPAEVVADAAQDVTITQDLLAGRVPKAYGGEPAPAAEAGGASGKPPPAPPPPSDTSVAAAQERILSKISIGASKTQPVSFQELYTDTIDDLNPFREIVKKMTGKRKLKDIETSIDPYQLARMTRGTFGRADHYLEYGTFDFNTLGDTGPAFAQVLAPVKNDLIDFRIYAAARRAVEFEGRDIESGFSLADTQLVKAAGDAEYGQIFDDVVAYQNELTRYLRDSDIVSDDAFQAMLGMNRDYIPFFRVMDDGSPGGPGSVGRGLQTKNPIHKVKGSGRDIVDPLESVIKNTYTYIALAEKNAVGRAFIRMGEDSGVPEQYFRKIQDPVRPIQVHEDEIRRMFKEFVQTSRRTTRSKSETSTTVGAESRSVSRADRAVRDRVQEALLNRGFSEGEVQQMLDRLSGGKGGDAKTIERITKYVETTTFIPELDIRLPNKVATLFRQIRAPLGKNQIAVFENGKRVVYEVDPDVAEVFRNIDSQTANILTKILAVPARTLRAGAVLSPEFIARNLLRDQLTATMFVPHYVPMFDFLSGALSLIKKDASFRNWLKGGGANSALIAMDRRYLQEHLFKLSGETGLASRALNVARSPLEMLRIASELIENATRVGISKRVTKGATSKAAIQKGSFVSREGTLDFARIGAKMRAYNMVTAFANAAIQGVDRTFRAFSERPVATSIKVGAGITLPSMLLWWANKDDRRYQELPQWQKDLFWIVTTDNWRPADPQETFPDYLTRTRNGVREVNDGTIYRIPKPFELGIVFGSLPERILDAYFTDNPDAFHMFEETLIQAFTPSVVPTAALPMLEQFANRSSFTGNPIVSQRAEGLLPEYQYNDYTTETAKLLGRVFGAFPGLTNKAIEAPEGSFMGGVSRALTTPALVENYIKAWTGGLGRYALQIADAGLKTAGVVPDIPMPERTLADIPLIRAFVVRYPSASARSIQRFYDRAEVNDRVLTTIRQRAAEGDTAAVEKTLAFRPVGVKLDNMRRTLSGQSRLVHLINRNPEMTPGEKRQLIDSIYFAMIGIAEAGNELMDSVESTVAKSKP